MLVEVVGGGSSGGGTPALAVSFWADIFLSARFHEYGVGAAADESEDEEREDFELVLIGIGVLVVGVSRGGKGRRGRIWLNGELLVVTVG